jgi:hypothetical protein
LPLRLSSMLSGLLKEVQLVVRPAPEIMLPLAS